jgi:hypothetical protein
LDVLQSEEKSAYGGTTCRWTNFIQLLTGSFLPISRNRLGRTAFSRREIFVQLMSFQLHSPFVCSFPIAELLMHGPIDVANGVWASSTAADPASIEALQDRCRSPVSEGDSSLVCPGSGEYIEQAHSAIGMCIS